MYNSNDTNQSRKAIYALIAIVAVAILVIVTISVVVVTVGSRSQVNIINEQPAMEQSSSQSRSTKQISDEELSNVKDAVAQLLESTKGVKEEFDVAVRWDSLKTTYNNQYPITTFLIDVDEYQQTYEVTVAANASVQLSCPELGESKYPESFCDGSAGEYDDSIGVVFGESLPYGGYTSEGEYFSISRNQYREDTDDPALLVAVVNCTGGQAAIERANAAVDEVIVSLGASPNLFSRYVSLVPCHNG